MAFRNKEEMHRGVVATNYFKNYGWNTGVVSPILLWHLLHLGFMRHVQEHIFLCKLDTGLKSKYYQSLELNHPKWRQAWLPQVWIVILAVVVLLVECSFFSQAVHTFHPWRLLCAIIHSSLSNNANCHHKQMPTYENISPPFSLATIRVLMISPRYHCPRGR